MITPIRNPFNGMWILVPVKVPDGLINYWNNLCEQDPK